jgi:hypothetical protein
MALGLYSAAADVIVLGTALTESRLKYVDQIDARDAPGPAFGVCQMERLTHDDHHRNFLAHMPVLRQRVLGLAVGVFLDGSYPSVEQTVWNLNYAFAMCRVDYRREKSPLPRWDDARGMAEYWKLYYNSRKGKGVVNEVIPHFEFATQIVKKLGTLGAP